MAYRIGDKRSHAIFVRSRRSAEASLKTLWQATLTEGEANDLREALQEANLAAARLLHRVERVETSLSICRQEIQTARDIASQSNKIAALAATEQNGRGILSA